jgi:glycosyltransferase involved in cell wall biosynthesis
MKSILMTAYAVNPFKGSEDGMGWNFVNQAAKNNSIIAITRKNNQPAIEKYMAENPSLVYSSITWYYYDLPYWMRFWKRGSKGAMVYYQLWQLFLPLFILKHKIKFDIVHHLNFHNDWTPSMMWTMQKPFVWGPIGHHPLIPAEFLTKQFSKKDLLVDRLLWMVKNYFWKISPLLKITKNSADVILAMNSSVKETLNITSNKVRIVPSVATHNVPALALQNTNEFNVLSVGRLVSLKGFDLTLLAFENFYNRLNTDDKQKVSLRIVGSGPDFNLLQQLTINFKSKEKITWIQWIDKSALDTIYKNSSVFMFPSHEGAGMVIAEAMSYSIPVVCLDNIGPGEFVHPDSILKVKYDLYDKVVEQLADKIFALFSSKSIYEHEKQLAFKRFQTDLSWDKRGEQLKEIYASL